MAPALTHAATRRAPAREGVSSSANEVGIAKRRDENGELGIRWKDDARERYEVEAVTAPAAGVLAVGDIVVSVNGSDVTGNNHDAGRTLFQTAPGTALKLGLASGKTVTVVAAKRN